jgi:DNA-directed RNA polymerase beta subunit
MPATILLKAMGMTSEDILSYYYDKDTFRLDGHQGPAQESKNIISARKWPTPI